MKKEIRSTWCFNHIPLQGLYLSVVLIQMIHYHWEVPNSDIFNSTHRFYKLSICQLWLNWKFNQGKKSIYYYFFFFWQKHFCESEHNLRKWISEAEVFFYPDMPSNVFTYRQTHFGDVFLTIRSGCLYLTLNVFTVSTLVCQSISICWICFWA